MARALCIILLGVDYSLWRRVMERLHVGSRPYTIVHFLFCFTIQDQHSPKLSNTAIPHSPTISTTLQRIQLNLTLSRSIQHFPTRHHITTPSSLRQSPYVQVQISPFCKSCFCPCKTASYCSGINAHLLVDVLAPSS